MWPIAINKTCIHNTQTTNVKNAGVRVLFEKYCRKTEKCAKQGKNEREKNTIVAFGYLSFISTSNNTNTIASTHIINPIQLHFTGERLLHRCPYFHLSIHQMALAPIHFLTLLFVDMQKSILTPNGKSVSKTKTKHKTS